MIEMGNLWLEVSLKDDLAEGSLGVLQLKDLIKPLSNEEKKEKTKGLEVLEFFTSV